MAGIKFLQKNTPAQKTASSKKESWNAFGNLLECIFGFAELMLSCWM